MNTRSTSTNSAVRTAIVTIILTAGLVSGFQAASTTMLTPGWDTGGLGVTGVVAPGDRYPVLIGSGYEGHVAATERDLDSARSSDQAIPFAAAKPLSGQPAANGSLWDTILAGSGYEGHERPAS